MSRQERTTMNDKSGTGHDRNRHGWTRALCVALAVVLSLSMAPQARGELASLWGIDEDDGHLFSLDDVKTTTGFTDYGPLKFDTGSGFANIGRYIEAFDVDLSNNVAFMAVGSGALNSESAPILVSFDLDNASTSSDNVVSIIGNIPIVGYRSGDKVSGLAVHPSTGKLYGVWERDDASTTDQLIEIDKGTGSIANDIGNIFGLGEVGRVSEDITFDENGNLYLIDVDDDHLYLVDESTGNIVAIVDNNVGGGIPGSQTQEALAWDFRNDELFGYDDDGNRFTKLSLGNGANTALGSIPDLTDVEGMAFVPEPGTLLLLIFGLALMTRPRRDRLQRGA